MKLRILPKRVEVLDVNDPSCRFRINIDVLNEAFGVGRSMYAKASFPDKKGVYYCGNNPQDHFFVWMPKLYNNSSDWINEISIDGTTIIEKANQNKHEDWADSSESRTDELRLVFCKEGKDSPYHFVGVFQPEKMDFCYHLYRRIATRVKLIGNPVQRLELLDDNRNR